MEKTSPPNSIHAWWLFGISVAGMVIFAGLYFFNPKTTIQTQTVTKVITNTVTNTVTNEVVKEVEKIVNVPAEIPEGYIIAWNLYKKFNAATKERVASSDQLLFNMKDVRAVCYLDTSAKECVSEDEVKAKFELTLRRNNVPINPKSTNTVSIEIDTIINPNTSLVCFFVTCEVIESQLVFREGVFHPGTIRLWRQDGFGTVGKIKANEALLGEVEKQAELFANDFLSANPKQ